MRVMVIVQATRNSEAGALPGEETFAAMGRFNEELVKAGIMLAGEGLHAEAFDFDVATPATPAEVMALFKRVIPTGIDHGTVTVVEGDARVEVTTFRGEGEYVDGRRPSSVTFHDDLEQDLARRDFTVNAMAWDPLAAELMGISATERPERIGAALKTQPDPAFDPPYTTWNVGVIQGGKARNIIAGQCRFSYEWRPLPGQDPPSAPACRRCRSRAR